MYEKKRFFPCPHNKEVMCSVKKCFNCGWHPNVAKYRLDKIIREREKENGQK